MADQGKRQYVIAEMTGDGVFDQVGIYDAASPDAAASAFADSGQASPIKSYVVIAVVHMRRFTIIERTDRKAVFGDD